MNRILRLLMTTVAGGLVLPLLVISGCQGNNINPVSAIIPESKPPPIDPATLQGEVLRFADDYLDRTSYAIDDYAGRVGTDEARRQAMTWKLTGCTSGVAIASGPNPNANLLDFLASTTVTRMSLEEVWIKTPGGGAFQVWLDASHELENKAWKLSEGVLTPDQRQELRQTIGKWWDANPDVHANLFVRPGAISSYGQQTGEGRNRPGSIFGLLRLDPTAGLDPAVREVTRSRLFAERAMFVALRTTLIVRLQVELLSGQLLREQQVTQALSSADRLSRAAESASQTAAELPDRITAERKAILAELETQEGRLRALSADVSKTLDAGDKMSASLNTTLVTFDGLMKRFGVGEPPATQSSPQPGPPAPPAPPFNILDYGRTAEQMATLAQQLDSVIKDANSTMDSTALDKRIADLGRLSRQTQADAKSVLNHAFLLAAGLVALIFAFAVAYRFIRQSSRSREERSMALRSQAAPPAHPKA